MATAHDVPRNRNVRLALAYKCVSSAATSVFSSQILAAFIYAVSGGSDAVVGIAAGVQGGAQLLFSIPGGHFADRMRRTVVMRWSLVLGFASLGVLAWAFVRESVPLIYAGSAVWGAFNGSFTGAFEATFADSLPHRRRSFVYTVKYALSSVGQAVGPAVCVAMFCGLGDRWETGIMRTVLIAGLGMAVPALALVIPMDERHTLPEEERLHGTAVVDATEGGSAVPDSGFSVRPLSSGASVGGEEEEEGDVESGPDTFTTRALGTLGAYPVLATRARPRRPTRSPRCSRPSPHGAWAARQGSGGCAAAAGGTAGAWVARPSHWRS